MYKIELDNEELYQVEHCIREGIKDCENQRYGYEGERNIDEEIKHTLENIINQIEKEKTRKMEDKRENAYVDFDNTVKCSITNGHCIRELGETCKGCEEIKEENNG